MAKFSALVAFLLVSGALFAIAPGDSLAVSVREGSIRQSPAFMSQITSSVQYGDSVSILEVKGDWVRVRTDAGAEGWINASAVAEPKTMNLTGSSGTSTGTSSHEIALAGRGFNQQVEEEYKSETDLDFTEVDVMEGYLVPLPELGQFLAAVGGNVGGEAQ